MQIVRGPKLPGAATALILLSAAAACDTNGAPANIPGEWHLTSVNGLTPREAVAERIDLSNYSEAMGLHVLRPGEWIRETRIAAAQLKIYPEGDFTETRVKQKTDIVSPEFWRRSGLTAVMPAREESGPDSTELLGTWSVEGDSIKLHTSREALLETLYEVARSTFEARGLSQAQITAVEEELRAFAEEQVSRLSDESMVNFRGAVVGDRLSGLDSNGLQLVFRRAGSEK